MKVSIMREKNTLNVMVQGRVNTDTAPVLEAAVREKMAGTDTDGMGKIDQVVFDFSEVEYVSSAGLRVVLNVYKGLDRDTGRVIISGANEGIRKAFRITGFTKYITMA